jgi:hypothetical protein
MMNQIVARNHIAITPNDSTVLYADALYVGGAGTVVCQDRDGTQVTYTVPAGGQVPTNVTKVMAASTATGIVGLIL